MKRNLNLSIAIVLGIVALIGLFFYPTQPIVFDTSFAMLFLLTIINILLTKQKIKTGVFLKIGKNNRRIWWSLFWLALGAYLIYSGLFIQHNKFSDIEPHNYTILGVLVLLNFIIFLSHNFIILIKDDSITFNETNAMKTWKFSKITRVVISDHTIAFIRKYDKKEYYFTEEEIQSMKKFLSDKLHDRLEIE